jgi:NADH:ubiquinone oxidoreductase subunit K
MSGAVQTRSYGSEGEILGAAYLLTTDIMFWSGLIGAVLFRRNLIVMLLCTEIVMLACNMNFLFASAYLNDMTVSSWRREGKVEVQSPLAWAERRAIYSHIHG